MVVPEHDPIPDGYYSSDLAFPVLYSGNMSFHGNLRQVHSDGTAHGSSSSSRYDRMTDTDYSAEIITRDTTDYAWRTIKHHATTPSVGSLYDYEVGYSVAGGYAFFNNAGTVVPLGYPLPIGIGDPGVNPPAGFVYIYAVQHLTKPLFTLRARDAAGGTSGLWTGDHRGLF